jgi:hypothetical protein
VGADVLRVGFGKLAGIPNLVTTSYDYLKAKQWVDLVDIVCPVPHHVDAAWAVRPISCPCGD